MTTKCLRCREDIEQDKPEYIIVNADRYDQYVEDDCNGVDPFPDKQEVFVPEERIWS